MMPGRRHKSKMMGGGEALMSLGGEDSGQWAGLGSQGIVCYPLV